MKKISLSFLFGFILCISNVLASSKEVQEKKLIYVTSLAEKIKHIMRDKSPRSKVIAKIADSLIDEVDIDFWSRQTLARNWNILNDQEKNNFKQTYRQLLAAGIRTNLKGIKLNKIIISKRVRDVSAYDDEITLNIPAEDGDVIELVLRLRTVSGGGFSAVNLQAENIDMLSSYRDQFNEYIDVHGLNGLQSFMKDVIAGYEAVEKL